MQKKLIALAVAGLMSGGAFAQSNVTISGQFRVGIDQVSGSGATAGVNPNSRTRVVDNNSNIKFAGTEDLGGGMKAWFQVESAIGTSDNVGTSGSQAAGTATSTGIGTRNTAVGLTGNWGSFLIGKWDMHYSSHAGVDGNGLAPHSYAMATSSLDILHTQNGANGGGTRFNNTIQYWSPTMSGFGVKVGYSTSGTNESTVNAAGKESNVWLNPTYSNGPIHAFYSYLKRSDVGDVNNGAKAKFNRLGGAYTLPMGLKLGLIWDTNQATAAAGGATTKRTAWALPISYTTGAHNIAFTYARAGDTGGVADTGAKMTMLGYAYSLSKRTSIGASWVSIKNEAAGAYDGWHPSSSLGATGGMAAGVDPRWLSFNMNHTF